MDKKTIITIIGGIFLFGAGFGGGVFYQKKAATSSTTTAGGFQMPNGLSGTPPAGMGGQGGPGGTGGGGGVSGEIVSKNDTSMTVKESDGSTVIVYYSSSTTFSKNETVSSSDFTVGTKVQVMGTTNSDKSVTSKSIMVQPETTSSAE